MERIWVFKSINMGGEANKILQGRGDNPSTREKLRGGQGQLDSIKKTL